MTRKLPLSLPRVTRVEVIDQTGRAFTSRYDVAGASVDVQDDGRTIKVFAAEVQPEEGTEPSSVILPPRPALQEAIEEALVLAVGLLPSPEYGGTLVDVVADHIYATFPTKKD